MWTFALDIAKRFGGWFVASLSVLALLRLSRKVGSAEQAAESAGERADDRERFAEIQIEQERNAASTRVDAVKVANEPQSTNAKLSDSDVTDKLRRKWSRD